MNEQNQPIIAGAGPVGLGAALFLARQGHAPRVIEERNEPSTESRALAVNPRTLDILEPTGITPKILELGLPIRGARFYHQEKLVASLPLAGVHPKYPFMIALSQASTERLLTDALRAAGGSVEHGVKLVDCRNIEEGVEAVLEPAAGSAHESVFCPWLLAADGAHSVARERLGIDFTGSSFVQEWYLADVPLQTDLAEDHVHIFFLDKGSFLFLVRVVDEALADRGGELLWRVIGNRPEPLSHLVQAEQVGAPLWNSSFRIAHRIDATLACGHVYFAGDAAHVHSPFGARGMNLGLEDAWVFAELVRTRRLAEYDALRRSVDRDVVRKVEFITRVASAESRFYELVRELVFPAALKLPFLQSRMKAAVTGLDHPLPSFAVDGQPASVAAHAEAG